MTQSDLLVITPTYSPDVELFARLHDSVRQFSGDAAIHRALVPNGDLAQFTERFPTCEVVPYSTLLPRTVRKVMRANLWVDVRRPFRLPTRGWIMQQVIKLAAAAAAPPGPVLIVDSDVELVREVTAGDLRPGGRDATYRGADIDSVAITRHREWVEVARELLGLPATGTARCVDYISALNVWDSGTVRRMLERVEQVSGSDWWSAVCRNMHFSEFVLYGIFVDECGDGVELRPQSLPTAVCRFHWGTTPLRGEGISELAGSVEPATVAVMISAKSGTSAEVRDEAMRACRRASVGQRPPDAGPAGSGCVG